MATRAQPARFKDDAPARTVARLRRILAEALGAALVEECDEPVPGACSARVAFPGTRLGANGKGVSRGLALASAYGELIERLQNQSLFRLQLELSDVPLDAHRFTWSPDEETMPASDAPRAFPELAALLASFGIPIASLDELVVQPFFSVQQRRPVPVPVQPLGHLYGTNGMCAGNTPAEALVQGLSEIVERFVMFRALDGGLRLPSIPIPRACEHAGVRRIVEGIAAVGRLQLRLYDASAVLGFPVAGAALVDERAGGYYVRWGAHPSPEIALERALTEIFQRRTLDTLAECLTPFSSGGPDPRSHANREEAFRTGIARYPAELLDGGPGPVRLFSFRAEEDNAALLRRMIALFRARGHDVLVRDVSFLGFPSYRVLVPGMSEIVLPHGPDGAPRREAALALRRLLARGRWSDAPAVRAALRALGSDLRSLPSDAADLLRLPLDGASPLRSVPAGLMLALLHLATGSPDDARGLLDRLAEPRPSSRPRAVEFYRCARDLLDAQGSGGPRGEAAASRAPPADPELAGRAAALLADPDSFFRSFARFRCWDCDACEERDACTYLRVKGPMSRVRARYVAHVPAQERLAAAL
jgi:ribosomal protein S12 methylthiotransferase accessory factor